MLKSYEPPWWPTANIYSKRKRKSIFHAVLKADKTRHKGIRALVHIPVLRRRPRSPTFRGIRRRATITQTLQTQSWVRAMVHLYLPPQDQHNDSRPGKPISGFCLIFFPLFQWKHPYDSLSCLILDTFSFCLSPVAKKRPPYEKGQLESFYFTNAIC